MSTTQSHWVAAKRMVALMISLLSVLPAFAEDKNQGLITAASKGHIEEITDLLKRGADVNATNRAGMTPLMMAASRGHLEAVKLLLEKGADVKAESIFGTALKQAAAGRHLEIVKLLLAKSDLSVTDNFGWSVLMRAVESGSLEMVELLLAQGVDVNAQAKDGRTALMIAASRKRPEIAKLLLERGAEANAKNQDGETALFSAVESGDPEVAEILLDNGAAIDEENEAGETPLLKAAEKGYVDVVRLLKKRGAESSVFVAAVEGDTDELGRFLSRGVHVDTRDKRGRTILMAAVKHANLEAARMLLEKGADVNALDGDGVTALQIANRDHKPIRDLLTAYGAKTAAELKIDRFQDRVAQRGGDLFFRLKDGTIISRRSTPAPREDEPDGYSDAAGEANVSYWFQDFVDPWYVVGEGYFEGCGTEYINGETGSTVGVHGISLISPDRKRFVVLQYPGESPCDTEIWKISRNEIVREWILKDACLQSLRWASPTTIEETRDLRAVGRLERDGASWNYSPSEDYGIRIVTRSPWREDDADYEGEAVGIDRAKSGENGLLEQVKAVLEKGSDINAKPKYGGSLLEKAALKGNLEVMKLLLDRGADVNAKGSNNEPPLLWASSRGQWAAAKLLLDRGADFEADSDFARTALTKAAGDGHLQIVNLFLKKGVAVNPAHGRPPLQTASGEGHLKIVKALLKHGADVNAKDQQGRSALMTAALQGKAEVVRLLLEKGASVDASDKDGWTPLMDASWSGDPLAVRLLLDKNADVGAQTIRGETALINAVRSGNAEVVRMLLERGAAVDTKPRFGQSPLQIAQKFDYKEIEELLKSAGAKD